MQFFLRLIFLFIPEIFASVTGYYEHLTLRPLSPSALLASFRFRSSISLADFYSHNFRLFPRSLGQILHHSGTTELHLRFTLGRWDSRQWGTRPWNGSKEGGTGVELWAWLDTGEYDIAEGHWLTLTNALSGLFCASLNFIDGMRSTRPVMSFQPENASLKTNLSYSRLFHGVLPHEVVCTENLTPFLKLLPCKGKSGIASLLDGHKLFDASFQSMAVDVTPHCENLNGSCFLDLEQTIDMVLDVARSKRPRENPIPRPLPANELVCDETKWYHNDQTCFPMDHLLVQDWKLSQLFGQAVRRACSLLEDDEPQVCVQHDTTHDLVVQGSNEQSRSDDVPSCYNLDFVGEFDLTLQKRDDGPARMPPLKSTAVPLLSAERSFTGYGQESGGVQSMLTNLGETDIDFVYMESLPWFMRVYLHTLEARIASCPTSTLGYIDNFRKIIKDSVIRPAIDRSRGTQLEILIRIPPRCTVLMTYDIEKAILRYTEYPPDANRGFDIAAAIVSIHSPSMGTSLRTTSSLLHLPTPDFSMPYNVIIFTSTAIALSFGGLYNILVRRFVGAKEVQGALVRIKRFRFQ